MIKRTNKENIDITKSKDLKVLNHDSTIMIYDS